MHSLIPYDPGFCRERLLNESVVFLDILILELEVFNAHRIDRGTKSSSMAEPYSVSPSAVLKKGPRNTQTGSSGNKAAQNSTAVGLSPVQVGN